MKNGFILCVKIHKNAEKIFQMNKNVQNIFIKSFISRREYGIIPTRNGGGRC